MKKELSNHPVAIYKREYRKKNPDKDRQNTETHRRATRKFRKIHREENQQYQRTYQARRYHEQRAKGLCASCKRPATHGVYCELHKAGNKRSYLKTGVETKLEVLSHYGKNGTLCCCWPECIVSDPDMLSIDHVNNDGNIARRESWAGSGRALYFKLRREDYPDGYQTLCHNHQWKKELMRKRGEV